MIFIPAEPSYARYSYSIDPKKEPKHLDWKPGEEANKNRGVAHCIYKIEGEKITIMFAPDGLPRGKRPLHLIRQNATSSKGSALSMRNRLREIRF